MLDAQHLAAPAATDHAGDADGRTARRDRNRDAVLDAVLELFAEGDLTPSAEQVAARSGVSLRSVYRYVADRADLMRAAIDRHIARVEPLFVIDHVGEGTFDERVERFVTARMRGYEAIAATSRASRFRAPTNDMIREQLELARRRFGEQVERQFAPELRAMKPTERRAALAAADALTQIETIDLYREHHRRSSRETRELLAAALRVLLQPAAAGVR